MGKTANASTRLATTTRGGGQASILAAQQFQDFFIQIQGGQSALVAFSQQASQLAFVMSSTQGAAGKFARFMAGGYGTLILAGVSVIGALTSGLLESKKAHEDVALGANTLANAQSVLGDVFDLVTGKIKSQNEVLQLNARLMAINLRADAQSKEASSNQTLTGARDYTVLGRVSGFFNRAPGVGRQNPFARASGDPVARDPVNRLLSGKIDSNTALLELGKLPNAVFEGSGASKDEVLKAVLDRASVKISRDIADQIDKSLDTGTLAAGFRKPGPKGAADAAARRSHGIDEFAESAADKVARINEAFDDQPRLIDRATQAGRALDDVISDINFKLKDKKLADAQRAALQATKAAAEKTGAVIERGLAKPYRDLVESQEQQLVIGDLVVRGRQDEADALAVTLGLQRTMGTLTQEQRTNIANNLVALRQQTREIEIQRQKQAAYLDTVDDFRSALTQGIAGARTQGLSSFRDIGKQFAHTFDNLFANVTVDNLFGDAFREIEDEVRGVKPASEVLVDAMVTAASKVELLGNAAAGAANRTIGRAVANDNDTSAADAVQDIIVTAKKASYQTDPVAFTTQIITRGLRSVLGADSPLADAIAKPLEKVGKFFEGTAGGMAIGSIAGGLAFGDRNSQAGSTIGGALGKKAGESLAKGAFGTALGKLSGALGPLGSIAGGLLGGALGGLFTTTKKASATIGGNSAGDLVITSLTGNSGSRKKASSEGADSTISSIEKIAEALGGTVNAAAGAVSIGVRKGSYRVDTTGAGRTKMKAGVLDFGEDAASAVRAATLNLIQDGVISGLRASTLRLLQSGTDLDAAIQKGLDFEGVFTSLKEYIDPVGAAIDAINKKFTGLQKTFSDAGASAEELASLEKLYGIQRTNAAKEAAKSLTGSLQDLLDNLNIGDSGYSLRTRYANAKAAYDPLATRVQAGDTTAFDDYSASAQTLIDISRQLYGSQSEYFDLLDQVKSLTGGTIDKQNKLIDAANGTENIFDSKPIVDATQQQTTAILSQLSAVNDNQGKIIAAIQALQASGKYVMYSTKGNF